MIIAIAAAWLIYGSEWTPIPFDSFDDCQRARQEMIDNGWRKGTCIHGKKEPKESE